MPKYIQDVSPGTESIDIEKSTHQKILKIYIFTNVGVANQAKVIDSISVTSHNYAIYRTTVMTHWLPICTHWNLTP